MWIVLDGDLTTGLDFTGPFDSIEEAKCWAETYTCYWLIVKLDKPS